MSNLAIFSQRKSIESSLDYVKTAEKTNRSSVEISSKSAISVSIFTTSTWILITSIYSIYYTNFLLLKENSFYFSVGTIIFCSIFRLVSSIYSKSSDLARDARNLTQHLNENEEIENNGSVGDVLGDVVIHLATPCAETVAYYSFGWNIWMQSIENDIIITHTPILLIEIGVLSYILYNFMIIDYENCTFKKKKKWIFDTTFLLLYFNLIMVIPIYTCYLLAVNSFLNAFKLSICFHIGVLAIYILKFASK